MKGRILTVIAAAIFSAIACGAVDLKPSYLSTSKKPGAFPLAEDGKVVHVAYDSEDHPGLLRAVANLFTDLQSVTGNAVTRYTTGNPQPAVLIIGTLGKSKLIDELVRLKKLNVEQINGKWEGFVITTVADPFPGTTSALVIAGSDMRGTIFGVYDLLQQCGVSPWHWWADVPIAKQRNLYVLPGEHVRIPAVKYRGIFINDEQPALGGWVAANYGGFNSKFYERVFELILRMRGNFLWPAMWGQSIASDDPESPRLANEMGIVIGTSHHEPMMRAHVEWQRNGGGPWNYATNEAKLKSFWREGIERMNGYESIVTLAMRGDGDEPMSEDANISLLQRIVSDQREIIKDVTEKPIEQTPQVWALYKEVQEYYDRGMRVPDDVTLLLCDDNWGNIRKLPSLQNTDRKGGFGIYYHFDYVGDPRNYKWINTNALPRIWEQMHLAWEYGARQIWIVNVGDIKPMEFPIEFFLDMAFDPTIKHTDLDAYTERWAAREFPTHGKEVASLLSTYAKFNSRRKPELLGPDGFSPNLYSLVNYREAETVVGEYNALAAKAEETGRALAMEYRDAYYQLVQYPVVASANINELYYATRLSRLYEAQGRQATNAMAERAALLFKKDAELATFYNKQMANGKWDHMMDQKRIGYKGWHDDFKENTMPSTGAYAPKDGPRMAIAVEGSGEVWEHRGHVTSLAAFDRCNQQTRYVEVFNKGTGSFSVKVDADRGVNVSQVTATVVDQCRIQISLDFAALKGNDAPNIRLVSSVGDTIVIALSIRSCDMSKRNGFLERDGYVSIEAPHFTRSIPSGEIQWDILPGHGRTMGAVTTFPAAAAASSVGTGPRLEYDIEFLSAGTFDVHCYFSPTIDFTAGNGLEYALSLDDGKPAVLNLHAKNTHRDWQESVKDNIRVVTSKIVVTQPGHHTLQIWRIDPGVVLQKIVIDTGGLKPSYLGPPESTRFQNGSPLDRLGAPSSAQKKPGKASRKK